jgi:hypothetical protein
MEENNHPQQPTPDQLLRLLDIQMAESRRKREAQATKSNTFRVLAMVIIVGGAALALWVLMYMLDEMRAAKNSEGADGSVTVESSR